MAEVHEPFDGECRAFAGSSAVERARALAEWAHDGQLDRYGRPVIDHVLGVAAAVAAWGDEHALVAALLHDAIEKGRATDHDLIAADIHPAAIELVMALTQLPGEPVANYLERCARHPVALKMKRADLLDKVDPERLRPLAPSAADEIRVRITARMALLAALQLTTPATGSPVEHDELVAAIVPRLGEYSLTKLLEAATS
ncbi:MAG: HD domain-containing protein [Acidimicrobiia bacterium]